MGRLPRPVLQDHPQDEDHELELGGRNAGQGALPGRREIGLLER